jgi:WD40 repeat protein
LSLLVCLLFLLPLFLIGCTNEQKIIVFESEYDTYQKGQKNIHLPPKYYLSPDRTKFAYVKGGFGDGKQCVDINDSEYKHFSSIENFLFSPDSKRFAYVANGNMVVVDEAESETYFGLTYRPAYGSIPSDYNPIQFSADSQHLAYIALTDSNKYTVVVDGVKHKPYDFILDPTNLRTGSKARLLGTPDPKPGVLFSPVGGRTAYIAGIGNNFGGMVFTPGLPGGGEFLVVDGVEGLMYDGVTDVTFSSDGRHIAYVARRIDDSNLSDYCVVIDGVESKWYHAMSISNVIFSPDGNTLIDVVEEYPLEDYLREFAVINNVEQPLHYEVCDIAFSPDGKHLAYVANDSRDVGYLRGESVVILDGVPGNVYFHVGWRTNTSDGLVFSPDSQRLAYVAVGYDKPRTLVVDGVEGKGYSSITDVTFGIDSQHVAYIANGNIAVLDGSETAYTGITGRPILVLSRDARRSAAVVWAEPNGQAVSVDGVPGKSYAWVSTPVFSPDNKHIVCVAQSEDGKYFTVVDGTEGKAYDEILDRDEMGPNVPNSDPSIYIVFDSDTEFHYLARDGDTLYLVHASTR